MTTYRDPDRDPVLEQHPERAYIRAVLRNDFARAARAFELIPRHDRRYPATFHPLPAGVRIRYRGSWLDVVLSHGGWEGVKGPWVIEHDQRIIVCAFDDQVLLGPVDRKITDILEKVRRRG